MKNSFFGLSREVRWLLASASRLSRFHLLTLISIVMSSLLALVDPLVLKWIIDTALPRGNVRILAMAAAIFCVAFLGRLVFSYVALLSSAVAAQKLIFRTRVQLVRRMNSLPVRYHDRSEVGDSLYRLEQDVDRIGELGGEILPAAVRMMVLAAMVFTTMLLLDARLTLLLCPLLVWFYCNQRRCNRELRGISEDVQQQSGAVTSLLEEHLRGMVQLKLLRRATTRTREIARMLAGLSRAQVRQRLAEMRFSFSSMVIIAVGNTLILGYGGYQVIRGQLTTGSLVAFYGYLLRLFEPLIIATDLQTRAQRVAASIERILEILENPELAVAGRKLRKLHPLCPARLEFRDVSFFYRENRQVLKHLSFTIASGEKVAIVGLNGSGKSSIGQLAVGLYTPHEGSVLINGEDVRQLSPGSLHSAVTLVPQEPVIFSGTVRENILYGDPGAGDSQILFALALSRLDEVIRRFPAGLDEVLGPRGRKLSGGERKRLALARVLLQPPEILILDEVTAALDEPVATRLLEDLERLGPEKIQVVITHRPATMQWADRILVIGQGSLIDDGAHDALLERCPEYRSIFRGESTIPQLAS
jgi:ABC-type multidrug transport system fused ATPase/permease subunit